MPVKNVEKETLYRLTTGCITTASCSTMYLPYQTTAEWFVLHATQKARATLKRVRFDLPNANWREVINLTHLEIVYRQR
jgi:hypothetical protein